MKLVKENIKFERNQDPKSSMGIGLPSELRERIDQIWQTELMDEQWAVCFDVELDYGGDVLFSKSDFIFNTVQGFFENKEFMNQLIEKLSDVDFWPEVMEPFTRPGVIQSSPAVLLLFFKDCDDNETYSSGFDAMPKEKYDEYLGNEEADEE